MENIKDILIKKVNNSYWWHVAPADPDAYKKRGKFLASTYPQAEFYGRPNFNPEKVNIKTPIYGFSEKEILNKLFGNFLRIKDLVKSVFSDDDPDWYKNRIKLDGIMYKQAKKLGYDAIVLLTSRGKDQLERNRKPSSIELNLLNI